MRKDDTVRLRHMLDAASEAMEFLKGKTRTDLDKNRMLVLSLVKEIEIIGEAAYQTNEDAWRQSPDIPWCC
jgi:uncharacterized protein with HEPN domain